jgi:O-antigen ligase
MAKFVIRHSSFVILVSLLAALIPTYLIRFEVVGIPTTLWEVALWVLVVFALGRGWLQLSFWKTEPLRLPLLLIILGSLVGLAIAPDLRAALGQWKVIILDGMLFYWLIRSASQDRKTYSLILVGALSGAGVVAVTALLAPFLGLLAPDGRTIGLYALDVGASPNYLALYLAPVATIALMTALGKLMQKAESRVSSIGYLVSGLIISGAAVVSGSRGGIVAILAGLLMGCVWLFGRVFPNYRRIVGVSALCLILLGAFLVGPQFLPNPDVDRDTRTRQTSSNNVRWEIWKTTGEILKLPQTPESRLQTPVWLAGLGFANYQPLFANLTASRVNYPEYITPYALHPHNFFLMTWLTLGLFGLLGWLLMLGILGRRLRLLSSWQILVLAALVTWFVQGLVDTTFYKNDLAPLTFLLIAGLVVSNDNRTYALLGKPQGFPGVLTPGVKEKVRKS